MDCADLDGRSQVMRKKVEARVDEEVAQKKRKWEKVCLHVRLT
jgi:hypothetical protein